MHYEYLVCLSVFALVMGGVGLIAAIIAANRESKNRHKKQDKEKEQLKAAHDKLGRL